MRIIAIENTKSDLNKLEEDLKLAFPGSEYVLFSDPLLAIKAYQAKTPDFTIFCEDMQIIDGFSFARALRKYDANFTGVMLAENECSRSDAENFFLVYQVKPYHASDLKTLFEKTRILQQKNEMAGNES